MSYISRQASIKEIENTDWYHINQNGELVSGANSQEHEPLYKASEIYAALEEVPSADVVEVVRCKDCVFGIVPDQDGNLKSRFCYNRNGLDAPVRDNDYCSFGERRTDG